jgi:hypothetical protein
MDGTAMKRAILVFRIILYLAVVFYAVQFLFFSEKSETELKSFEKDQKKQYIEYNVRYIEENLWIALQILPVSHQIDSLKISSIWTENEAFLEKIENRRLKFRGIRLQGMYMLDDNSFFVLAKNIEKLKSGKDKILNKLHKKHGLTFIFEKK